MGIVFSAAWKLRRELLSLTGNEEKLVGLMVTSMGSAVNDVEKLIVAPTMSFLSPCAPKPGFVGLAVIDVMSWLEMVCSMFLGAVVVWGAQWCVGSFPLNMRQSSLVLANSTRSLRARFH